MVAEYCSFPIADLLDPGSLVKTVHRSRNRRFGLPDEPRGNRPEWHDAASTCAILSAMSKRASQG